MIKSRRNEVLAMKYYVDAKGHYLGSFATVKAAHDDDLRNIQKAMPRDPDAVEVPTPPNHISDKWDGKAWVPQAPPARDLDAELAKQPDWVRALVELVPGGASAVKAKIATLNT